MLPDVHPAQNSSAADRSRLDARAFLSPGLSAHKSVTLTAIQANGAANSRQRGCRRGYRIGKRYGAGDDRTPGHPNRSPLRRRIGSGSHPRRVQTPCPSPSRTSRCRRSCWATVAPETPGTIALGVCSARPAGERLLQVCRAPCLAGCCLQPMPRCASS